jgi:hypothetical protein
LISKAIFPIDTKGGVAFSYRVLLRVDGLGSCYRSVLNQNDGEILGSPKWVKGKFGMALEFDGQDDVIGEMHNPM